MSYTIAFDIGGTNIKAGIVENGKVMLAKTASTPKGKSILDAIASLIESLSNDAKIKSNGKIKSVCLGVPGVLHNDRLTAGNLNLIDYPIKSELQKKLNGKSIPIYLGNDTNCFALAEATYGAGKNYCHTYSITLGTGIGGGLVVDKQVYKGAGNASEPCYMTIKFDGIKDKHGNYGAFEEYCSARGVLRIAEKHNLVVKTPLDVYNLAKENNKDAIDCWNEYGFYLGIGIANIISLLNPELIVLGGGLSAAWPYFKKEMFKTIKERALFKDTPVVKSELKDAGILGASLLAKQ